jgi:hypothetical protein
MPVRRMKGPFEICSPHPWRLGGSADRCPQHSGAGLDPTSLPKQFVEVPGTVRVRYRTDPLASGEERTDDADQDERPRRGTK